MLRIMNLEYDMDIRAVYSIVTVTQINNIMLRIMNLEYDMDIRAVYSIATITQINNIMLRIMNLEYEVDIRAVYSIVTQIHVLSPVIYFFINCSHVHVIVAMPEIL